jgi:hypothetical protein
MWSALALLTLGLVPAWIGWRKRKPFFVWWLYGAVLPMLALPHALWLAPRHPFLAPRTPRNTLRYCGACATYPTDAARICPSCGAELPPRASAPSFEWEMALIVAATAAIVLVCVHVLIRVRALFG